MSDVKDDAAALAEAEAAELAAIEDAAFESGFPEAEGTPEKVVDNKPEKAAKKAEKERSAQQNKADAHVDDKSAKAPDAKVDDKPADPPVPVAEVPEYVQISAKEWGEIKAAAAKTASYDQQFSRAFGTLGNVQKLVNGMQERTAAGRKIEIPKDAFAAMEKDFPELAQQTRAALEAALSGVTGTGGGTPPAETESDKMEARLAAMQAKREIEVLEDEFPDWRTTVGAVDVSKEQPDPNNAFRKWLATKPEAYQERLNASESAGVISRAIRSFEADTKTAEVEAKAAADEVKAKADAKVAEEAAAATNAAKLVAAVAAANPRSEARADRIRDAITPKGDGAGVPAGKSDDDFFEEGFRSR